MTSGRAPGSNQGGNGLLPDAEDGASGAVESDDNTLPGSGDGTGGTGVDVGGDVGTSAGAGGGDDDTLPDAGDGTGDADESDDDMLPDAEQPRQTRKPTRKRGGVQNLSLRKPSKHDSLLWHVKEAVSDVLSTLRDRLRANFDAAMATLVEIRNDRTGSDQRTLTYKQIEDALSNPESDLEDFRVVANKLEKFDYRLYGIKIRGGGQEGTQVKDAETNKTGCVTGVDKEDGYNGFEIQWKDCDELSRYSTREVLEGAERIEGDQGVTSPAADDKRVRLFLQAVLCMCNVPVKRFVVEDDPNVTRVRHAVALPEESCVETMELRQEAWYATSGMRVTGEAALTAGAPEEPEEPTGAPLTDTMTECEQEILKRSPGRLLEEAGRKGSLFEALGLLPNSRSNYTGFVTSQHTFHGRHERFVNHFVRGAQVSWKLGRPTCLESCIAPFSAGHHARGSTRGEVDELSGHWTHDHERSQTEYTFQAGAAPESACGLGMRLVLARARVTTGYGSACFKWWSHFPLYMMFELTRPKHLGQISATTENTSRVSQVRREFGSPGVCEYVRTKTDIVCEMNPLTPDPNYLRRCKDTRNFTRV